MIKILIADDFNLLREDLKDLINSQADMEVVGLAGSGKEIIELASQTEFDLILMDIEMENKTSGIKAAEVIKDQKKSGEIIFLSAHETSQVILTAMAVGAVGYLVKGCKEEDILRYIRSAYEGQPIMEGKIHETIMQEYARLRKSEKSLLFFIDNISKLTSTERELVRLLLLGKKVTEIAEERCVEVVTVKTQIKGLLRKFGCSRTKEIVKMIQNLNVSHLFM